MTKKTKNKPPLLTVSNTFENQHQAECGWMFLVEFFFPGRHQVEKSRGTWGESGLVGRAGGRSLGVPEQIDAQSQLAERRTQAQVVGPALHHELVNLHRRASQIHACNLDTKTSNGCFLETFSENGKRTLFPTTQGIYTSYQKITEVKCKGINDICFY